MLRDLPDDGLFLPSIKSHSLDKIVRHDFYVRVFATAMKYKWPQRAYIGLYSGAGRARLDKTGEIVETTAMSACRLADPFTKYIFVDQDERCTEALAARIDALPVKPDVTILTGDVNGLVPQIKSALPNVHTRARPHLIRFCRSVRSQSKVPNDQSAEFVQDRLPDSSDARP